MAFKLIHQGLLFWGAISFRYLFWSGNTTVRVCLADNPHKNSNNWEESQKEEKEQTKRRKNNKNKKANARRKNFVGTGNLKIHNIIQVYSILEKKGGEPHLAINSTDGQSSN